METIYYEKNQKFSTEYFIKSFYLNANEYNLTEFNLLLSLLASGTKKYDSKAKLDKISRELYGLNFGLSVSETIDKLVFEYNFSYLDPSLVTDKDYTYEEINKFIDEFINCPNIVDGLFRKDLFETEKRNMKTGILARLDNKKYVLGHDSYVEYFKDTTKVFLDSTLEELAKVTNEGLVSLYNRIKDNNSAYNFCYSKTDFSDNSIANRYELTDKIVGYKFKSNFKKDFYQVKKEYENNSSYLFLAFDTGVHYQEHEILALNTFNEILGGGANSRLFKYVREEKGLCYSIYSACDREYGKLFIAVYFDNKDYDEIKEIIMRQLAELQKGNIDEKEIKEAKLSQINNLKVTSDNPKYYVYKLKRHLLYKQLTVAETEKQISEVSKDEVVAIANRLKLEYEFLGVAK